MYKGRNVIIGNHENVAEINDVTWLERHIPSKRSAFRAETGLFPDIITRKSEDHYTIILRGLNRYQPTRKIESV